VLARGTVSTSAIGARALTLRMPATGRDAAPGFAAGERTGGVALDLRLDRVRVSTSRRTRVVR
jgi:hypothetical protein